MDCEICSVPYNLAHNPPKVLSCCGRSICSSCCADFDRSNINLCPFCRTILASPFSELKKNLALIANLEDSKVSKCAAHHKENVFVCEECLQELCPTCALSHNRDHAEKLTLIENFAKDSEDIEKDLEGYIDLAEQRCEKILGIIEVRKRLLNKMVEFEFEEIKGKFEGYKQETIRAIESRFSNVKLNSYVNIEDKSIKDFVREYKAAKEAARTKEKNFEFRALLHRLRKEKFAQKIKSWLEVDNLPKIKNKLDELKVLFANTRYENPCKIDVKPHDYQPSESFNLKYLNMIQEQIKQNSQKFHTFELLENKPIRIEHLKLDSKSPFADVISWSSESLFDSNTIVIHPLELGSLENFPIFFTETKVKSIEILLEKIPNEKPESYFAKIKQLAGLSRLRVVVKSNEGMEMLLKLVAFFPEFRNLSFLEISIDELVTQVKFIEDFLNAILLLKTETFRLNGFAFKFSKVNDEAEKLLVAFVKGQKRLQEISIEGLLENPLETLMQICYSGLKLRSLGFLSEMIVAPVDYLQISAALQKLPHLMSLKLSFKLSQLSPKFEMLEVIRNLNFLQEFHLEFLEPEVNLFRDPVQFLYTSPKNFSLLTSMDLSSLKLILPLQSKQDNFFHAEIDVKKTFLNLKEAHLRVSQEALGKNLGKFLQCFGNGEKMESFFLELDSIEDVKMCVKEYYDYCPRSELNFLRLHLSEAQEKEKRSVAEMLNSVFKTVKIEARYIEVSKSF